MLEFTKVLEELHDIKTDIAVIKEQNKQRLDTKKLAEENAKRINRLDMIAGAIVIAGGILTFCVRFKFI